MLKFIKNHKYAILFTIAGCIAVYVIGLFIWSFNLTVQYRKFYAAFSNSYYSCNEEDITAEYNGESMVIHPALSYRLYVYISAVDTASPDHKEKNLTDGPLVIRYKDGGSMEIYAEKVFWSDRIRDIGVYAVYHYPNGKSYHFLTDKMSLSWILNEIDRQKYDE